MFSTEVQLSVILFHENGDNFSKLRLVISGGSVEIILCECSVDGCDLYQPEVVATISKHMRTARGSCRRW